MLQHIHLSKYRTRASFCLLLIPVLLLLAACSIIPDTSTSTLETPTTAVSTPTGTSTNATPVATTKPTKNKKGTSAITITDTGLTPATLTIKVGTMVTWTNTGAVDHTITSTNGSPLKSGPLTAGNTYSFKFTKAGTYTYKCAFQASFMIGKIIVK